MQVQRAQEEIVYYKHPKTEDLKVLEKSLAGAAPCTAALKIWRFMLDHRYSEEISISVGRGCYVVIYLCPETGAYAAYVGGKKKFNNMSSQTVIKDEYELLNQYRLETLQENDFRPRKRS